MFEETFSQLLNYHQHVINAQDQLTDRTEALLCGFLIKPSLLYPSHTVSESSLYFVVSHSPTRSHHHMVIVRPPLLHARISVLQSLTDIVSDLSSYECGFHLGTLLVWNSSNLRTVGSSGCSYQLRCVFLERTYLFYSYLQILRLDSHLEIHIPPKFFCVPPTNETVAVKNNNHGFFSPGPQLTVSIFTGRADVSPSTETTHPFQLLFAFACLSMNQGLSGKTHTESISGTFKIFYSSIFDSSCSAIWPQRRKANMAAAKLLTLSLDFIVM